MTPAQLERVRAHVTEHRPNIAIAVHGDCTGADEQFDQIVHQLAIPRSLFPSDIEAKQAKSRQKRPERLYVHPAAPPLERNKRMVQACYRVIATPKGMEAERRSGTWATIRAAKKAGKPVTVFWPDGTETRIP
jgi:hypothetical protein